MSSNLSYGPRTNKMKQPTKSNLGSLQRPVPFGTKTQHRERQLTATHLLISTSCNCDLNDICSWIVEPKATK